MSQGSPRQISKRPKIEDFFKPFAQTESTIPRKRASPSSANDEEEPSRHRHAPKTPAKTVTFKDVTPSNIKPLYFSPRSQSSLPIRSPKPNKISSPSTDRQTLLFENLKRSTLQNTTTNTSFTFSDVSARSQNVVEHGKVIVVKDSDDDTESLESLDDIFGRRKDAAMTSDSSPLEDAELERIKTLNMFTAKKAAPIIGKDKLRALRERERATKFDLGAILDDHFGDEETEQNISRMRLGFDGAKDLEENDHLDKDLLASVVRTGDTDQDDVDRLLHAVERTEALASEKKFSFFKTDAMAEIRRFRAEAFPKSAIPDEIWVPQDSGAQIRAYLSGYMSELAAANLLADEAFRWTFMQVARESQADLRQAYLQCLEAGSKASTRLNISAADIQSLFQDLGAHKDCLKDASPIEAKSYPIPDQEKQDYSYLLAVLQMLFNISPDMDFPALSKLCSVVLRLTIDRAIMSDNRICVAVESLLERLLSLPDTESRHHAYDRLHSDATEHLDDPQLQIQLLRHMLPTSTQSIKLHKTLADVFLLGSPAVNQETCSSNATLIELSNHVSISPSFSLIRHSNSSAIDYAALTSKTQILNMCVSSGNPPTAPEYHQVNDLNQSISKKASLQEVAFNKSVDTLADQLHNLFVSIKDTGASHMRRTEAKDALQALYFRLLFTVRTKVRKKKHVFDSSGEMKGGSFKARWVSGDDWREKERAGDFMKKFFGRKEGTGT